MAASAASISDFIGKVSFEESSAQSVSIQELDQQIIDTVNQLSDPVFITCEKTGFILYMNLIAKEKIGERYLGQHFSELIPQEHREAHKGLYQKTTESRFFPAKASLVQSGIRMGNKLEHKIPMMLQADPLLPPVIVPVEIHVSVISKGYSCQVIDKTEIIKSLQVVIDRQRTVAHEGRNVRMAAIANIEASLIIGKKKIKLLEHVIARLEPDSPLQADLETLLLKEKESCKLQYLALCSEKYVSVIENYMLSPNDKEDFCITKAINTMINLFSSECEGKITLIKDGMLNLDSQLIVNGSKTVMLYSLANLLKNAIKFTMATLKPTKTITVLLEMVDKGVQISVTDTGLGMTPEHRKRCLGGGENKFNQSIKGNGSGLSHIKQSLQKINSDIFVESVFGEGTTFKMVFPFTITHTLIDKINYNLIRVLVVDDDSVNRRVLKRILTGIGFKQSNVIDTGSPEEALALFKDNLIKGEGFHIVLTDLCMPQATITCNDLIEEIKVFELSMKNILPANIVIISGEPLNLEDKDCEHRLKLADRALTKPCVKDVLMLALLPYVLKFNAAIATASKKAGLESWAVAIDDGPSSASPFS